jgi:uncharacterized protein with GYD domain
VKKNNPKKQTVELEQILNYLLQHNGVELLDRIHTFSIGLFVKHYGLLPKEIDAIIEGKITADDSVKNLFNRFIEYKKQIDKIGKKTIKIYNYQIKSVIENLNIILTEGNIKIALENFIRTTTLQQISINNILTGLQTFF